MIPGDTFFLGRSAEEADARVFNGPCRPTRKWWNGSRCTSLRPAVRCVVSGTERWRLSHISVLPENPRQRPAMLVRRPLSFSRARRKCPIRDAGCEANQGICKVTYPRVAVVAFGGQRVKVQLH